MIISEYIRTVCYSTTQVLGHNSHNIIMPFYAPDPEQYAEDHIDGTDQFLKTLSIYIYNHISLSIYINITQINPEAVGKAW